MLERMLHLFEGPNGPLVAVLAFAVYLLRDPTYDPKR